MGNKYLLDTCIFIELSQQNAKVIEKIRGIGICNCYMSIITYYELIYGAYNAPEKYREKEILKVRKIVEEFKVIKLPISEDYAKNKIHLLKKGNFFGDFDLMIALTALVEGLIMVTNNTKHFSRIEDLEIESWI